MELWNKSHATNKKGELRTTADVVDWKEIFDSQNAKILKALDCFASAPPDAHFAGRMTKAYFLVLQSRTAIPFNDPFFTVESKF